MATRNKLDSVLDEPARALSKMLARITFVDPSPHGESVIAWYVAQAVVSCACF